LSLVACGSDRGVVTAPSTVQAAAAASAALTIAPEQMLPRAGVVTTTPITVTSLVSGTSCPTLQFMVYSYLFKVDGATQYEGGACANIQPGSKINFSGSRESESSPVFSVARVSFVTGSTTPPSPTPTTTPVSTDVTVSSLVSGTACPTLSFMVGPYTVSLSSSTVFERGECANIAAGMKLGLTGTRQGDGVIAASKIQFRDTTTNPTNPGGRPIEGEGVITTLRSGTACPELTFYIASYVITLDTATVFDRGACSDLGTGVRVHVKGGLTSDRTVLATQISVQSDSPGRPVAEGEGRVTSLVSGTSCPALAFMIEEYTVTLDASTTFVGGTCGEVAAGKKLGVKGTVTGEKQVLATQIVFKNGDGN
jgi:hypothetical protein